MTIAPIVLFYFAANPGESFYKDEFTFLTGKQFPKNGKLVDYSSTFPDFQGDYSVCGLFTAPKKYVEELSKSIPVVLSQHKPRMFCNHDFGAKYFYSHHKGIEDNKRTIQGSIEVSLESNVILFRAHYN